MGAAAVHHAVRAAAPRGLTAQLLPSLERAAASRCGSRGGRLGSNTSGPPAAVLLLSTSPADTCACGMPCRRRVRTAGPVCPPQGSHLPEFSFLQGRVLSFAAPSTCRNSEPCHREIHWSATCVRLKALACELKEKAQNITLCTFSCLSCGYQTCLATRRLQDLQLRKQFRLRHGLG